MERPSQVGSGEKAQDRERAELNHGPSAGEAHEYQHRADRECAGEHDDGDGKRSGAAVTSQPVTAQLNELGRALCTGGAAHEHRLAFHARWPRGPDEINDRGRNVGQVHHPGPSTRRRAKQAGFDARCAAGQRLRDRRPSRTWDPRRALRRVAGRHAAAAGRRARRLAAARRASAARCCSDVWNAP